MCISWVTEDDEIVRVGTATSEDCAISTLAMMTESTRLKLPFDDRLTKKRVARLQARIFSHLPKERKPLVQRVIPTS
jgi:hypothetical protein